MPSLTTRFEINVNIEHTEPELKENQMTHLEHGAL
jgi:hypothetical protein